MVTKKTTKKTPAVKSAPKKVVPASAKTTVTRVVSTPATKHRPFKKPQTTLPKNLVNIIIAELIGTFVLTIVALFSAYFMAPFYIGLVLVLMVLTVGAISGSHINPAVTFGLWSMRKLPTILVPFYWAAQFLGAMAAVVLLGSLSAGGFAVHFDQFMAFSWSIFAIELIGMAILMFGIAAVLSRNELRSTSKAIGIGMSLTIGLLVAGSLMPFAQNSAMTAHQDKQAKMTTESEQKKDNNDKERSYPREIYINGATLNPAVALAVTEKTDSQLQSGSPVAQKGEKSYTRLSMEVIVATLIGAALGGNLFLLVNYRNKNEL